MRRLLSVLCAVGASTTCLLAEDVVVGGTGRWDFRAQLSSYPGIDRSKYDYDVGGTTKTDWQNDGGSLDLLATYTFPAAGPNSWYVDFGGFVRGTDSDTDPKTGVSARLGAAGIAGGVGWSFRPTPWYTLEAGPQAGLGGVTVRESGPGYKVDSDSGSYASIAAEVRNEFNIHAVQLGVTLGYAAWGARTSFPSFTNGGTTVSSSDATYSGEGGYVGFTVGWRH